MNGDFDCRVERRFYSEDVSLLRRRTRGPSITESLRAQGGALWYRLVHDTAGWIADQAIEFFHLVSRGAEIFK